VAAFSLAWLAADKGQGERTREDAEFEASLARLPSLAEAQLTRVVHVKHFLSESELRALDEVLECQLLRMPLGTFSRDSKGIMQLCDAPWETTYLHTDHSLQKLCPRLREQLLTVAEQADASEGWGLLPASRPDAAGEAAGTNFRVIELHRVRAGGALPDPAHFDGGSLVTIDVMLSEPGRDFTGGQFCTPEADGSTTAHGGLERGDALVFVSHKRHHVRPVESGLRRVLVAELWDGPERACAHRCLDPRGECHYSTAIVHAERFLRAEIPEPP
jgi:hypothetical protein